MDLFERKVQAAAIAAWWLVLVVTLFLSALWIFYLAVLPTEPAWMMSVWGPGLTWDFVRTVFFWSFVGMKLIDWLLAMAALWLTLWARQLRRQSRPI
jgi:hypothetical protein